MISLWLICTAALESGRLTDICVRQISLARVLTETRPFLKPLASTAEVDLWPSIWGEFVQYCARLRVHSKPGRQFPREWQEYPRKSRSLQKRRPRHRTKGKKATPLRPQPETRKDSNGAIYLTVKYINFTGFSMIEAYQRCSKKTPKRPAIFFSLSL
jgi:hypothetical protein